MVSKKCVGAGISRRSGPLIEVGSTVYILGRMNHDELRVLSKPRRPRPMRLSRARLMRLWRSKEKENIGLHGGLVSLNGSEICTSKRPATGF